MLPVFVLSGGQMPLDRPIDSGCGHSFCAWGGGAVQREGYISPRSHPHRHQEGIQIGPLLGHEAKMGIGLRNHSQKLARSIVKNTAPEGPPQIIPKCPTSSVRHGGVLSERAPSNWVPVHDRAGPALRRKNKRVRNAKRNERLRGRSLLHVKTWAKRKATETVLNKVWRLAVGGGWRLAVGGPEKMSLTAVLNKNEEKLGRFRTALRLPSCPSASWSH